MANANEYKDLLETACTLIYDLVRQNPLVYMQPDFQEDISAQVCELWQSTTSDADAANVDLDDMIAEAFTLFYQLVAPPRSNGTTYIINNGVIDKEEVMTEKLQTLRNLPQPEQRTPAWYAFRHDHLTASNAYKTFGSECARNQLIYDKCKPLCIEKYTGAVNLDSPMHWGQKYEAISIKYYEEKYATQVAEFGCLPHPSLTCLAASPDGINMLASSPRYGRMLEVKNIVNREITGIPKLEYWVQMQLQMEVFDLNECDFLETRFVEYDDQAAFLADVNAAADGHEFVDDVTLSKTGLKKGMLIAFSVADKPLYIEAPFNLKNVEQLAAWETDVMQQHEGHTWMQNIYWRLEEVSCVLVLRNKLWFQAAEPRLQEMWDIICKERVTGYEHRAPTKRANNINILKENVDATVASSSLIIMQQ